MAIPGKGLDDFFQLSAGILDSFAAAEGPKDLPAQPHLLLIFLLLLIGGCKFIAVVSALPLLVAKSVTFSPWLTAGFPQNLLFNPSQVIHII